MSSSSFLICAGVMCLALLRSRRKTGYCSHSCSGDFLFDNLLLFYLAVVFLRLGIVVDAYKDNASGIVSQLAVILLAVYLVNGSLGRLILLQFQQDGRTVALLWVLPEYRDKHD